MHRGSKHSVALSFCHHDGERMGVGAGSNDGRVCWLASDSGTAVCQRQPGAPHRRRARFQRGCGQQRWAWELACQRLRRCGLSATARCAPCRRARSQRGCGQQRWAWEPACQRFRRCGLSVTARCAPRRQTRSQRGGGQQRWAWELACQRFKRCGLSVTAR